MSTSSEEYLSSLRELTFNSRPQINMLTMLAEDYCDDATNIACTIETYLTRMAGDKLPVLYLIDSIVKNVGKDYIQLFSRNLPTMFARVFEEANNQVRNSLYKLRMTWKEVFPKEKLAQLDTLVSNIDSDWPVVVRPSNIHVNPNFIKGGSDRYTAVKDDIMREKLLKEKKVLLELKKKKVELELLQTKEVLEKEQKKLESFTTFKGETKPLGVMATDYSLGYLERFPQPVETFQPSSSLKSIESENSKKLLEVSIRDPRRKIRKKDPPLDSPLSPASPVTDLELGSPYNSEDSRDRPPRKKYKSKEKKRLKDRDKESLREHKKLNKSKMSDDASDRKRDNGHSYKPATDVCLDYGDMDLDSPQDSRLSDELLVSQPSVQSEGPFIVPTESSRPLDLVSSTAQLVDESPKIPSSISADVVTTVKPITTEPAEIDKTGLSSRLRDPRLAVDSSRTLTREEITKPSQDAYHVEQLIHSTSDSSHMNTNHPSGVLPKSATFSITSGEFSVEVPSLLEDSVSAKVVKEEMEICESPSIDTLKAEDLTMESSEGSLSLEEMFKMEENSSFDVGNKIPSKRKLDQEEDNEKHKKRLISELTENESTGHNCPIEAVSSGHLSLKSPSPEAPPPPSIPPLVDKSIIKEELELELSKSVVDPLTPSSPALVSSEETGKDIDLRLLLPRPVDRVKEDVKLEKTELDPMTLFGGEDVDYRQKPPQADFNMPSPPPPPVISNLHEGSVKKSWAQIKDRKSEERSPKVRPDRSKRSSISQTRLSTSHKDLPRQDSESHCNLLIKEAEEQLRNENITFVEYNRMLQEVVTINEERILKEAKARLSNPPTDNLEDSRTDSPIDEVDSSFESDRHEKVRDTKDLREMGRVMEPSRTSSRIMEPPQLDPRAVPPRQPLLPEEPFKRDRPDRERFHFPERRDMHPPPPPNMMENFVRQRPPMQPCLPFSGPNMPFQMNFRPRMPQNMVPTLLPHAGIELLMEADRERLDSILIGGHMRQVRFYGTTAVVLQSWDDPREVRFPVERRSLFVDTRHEFILVFGDSPTEIIIDGMSSLVQLGAPTRELYIDNKFFSINFGGRPVEVLMCGRVRSICLAGPPPIVRFGPVKRTDLVAGSVSLYVNAKTHFQFHLDAKPQKFHIEGEPCVLQFADSLQTVLINGVPVPLEFGSSPHPVMFKGVTHFLRLTCLPYGIVPGQISIMNMESFAHPPAPMMPPPMMPPPQMVEPTPPQVFLPPLQMPPPVQQQPVDLLASMMNPPPAIPTVPSDKSYSVEPPAPTPSLPEDPPPESAQEVTNFNINDLFQKLIQTGILHSSTPATLAPEPPEVKTEPPEMEADFSKPESLKAARPILVTKLYSGIQCSSCGIRFPPEGTKMYSRHLDWHFRQNRREKHSTKRPQCRGWYYDFSNWMQYQELEDPDEDDLEHRDECEEEEAEEDIPSVAVGHRKDVECRVCGEKFEEFFDHETEEWHARNALLVEESFYHPLCYEEFKNKKETEGMDLHQALDEEEEAPPLEDPSIEFIDLDDTEVPSPVPSPDTESLPLLGVDKQDSPDVIAIDDLECDAKEEEIPCPKEETKEEPVPAESDDDILDIIPIERKIESVELLDDDEEEKPVDTTMPEIPLDETKTEEEDFDFSKVTVKKEKDRVVVENVDSSQPTYTTTIDGNIVHDAAVPLVLPTRIKININRSAKQDGADPEQHSTDSNEAKQSVSLCQETVEPPQSVKPRLAGLELTQQPAVEQGVELSGLCSIM